MFMFMQAYGEKFKSGKYYCCATLLIYESIWVLSIFTYFSVIMNTWSIEKCLEAIKNTPVKSILLALVELLYFTMSKLVCFPQWIRNTFVHIWLCRCKILAVSKLEKKTFSQC